MLLSSTISLAVGLIYPAYATWKTILTATDVNKKQETAPLLTPTSSTSTVSEMKRSSLDKLITQWTMYWIVMAVFTVCEVLCENLLLAGAWFPLYHELKVVFILWLTLPQFRGATKIYRKFLAPALETYENDIDGHLDVARRRVTKEIGRGVAATGDFVRKRGSSLFQTIASSVSSLDEAAAAAEKVQDASTNNNQKDK